MPRVSKTSGQGVSRKAYQTAYRSGARGTGAPGGGNAVKTAPVESTSGTGSGSARSYEKAGGMNVSYGNTLSPTDLTELGGMPPVNKNSRALKLTPSTKKWT